ncbi:MAG: DUF1552 domain-containing protein [Myxococcaceae bacterium]|nr:DUF1552 domain-containing protein [Myxococcaceae bacterium]
MTYDRLSRRMFLRGAAGAWLAIPLLESLLPAEARAQGTPVRRFISIITPYDMGHHAAWLPNTGSPITNLAQPAQVLMPGNGHHAIRHQPLRDFVPTSTSPLSLVAGAHFNPWLSSMTIMRSLNHSVRYGHGAAWVLGGIQADAPERGALPTIETADVVLNKHRGFNPAGLPHIFCGNAGYGPDTYSYVSSGGPAGYASCLGEDLTALYNRLFSNGALPEGGSTTSQHPRHDILSRVQEDYRRVRNSRFTSAADKRTLDNALDQFRDAQASLTRVTTSSCTHRTLGRSGQVWQAASQAAVGQALADLIAAAIMCDSARVFTIGAPMLGGTLNGQVDQHEEVSHVPFSTFGGRPSWQLTAERKTAIARTFVAPLLQRLASAIDPSNGRSYLYNSLVYFTAESGIAHGYGSHPVMLFGNAGGSLGSGHYIDYANRAAGTFAGGDGFSEVVGSPTFGNNWWGASYNRLLVTVLQAMGLTPQDYENQALNAQLYNRTDLGPNNRNLTNLGGFGYAMPRDLSGENTSSWGFNHYLRPGLEGQDLRQFRHPLPMPPA